MSVKYQVFISSTYEDLREERDQVVRAILEMGHIPVGMEMFSAADEEQWKIMQCPSEFLHLHSSLKRVQAGPPTDSKRMRASPSSASIQTFEGSS